MKPRILVVEDSADYREAVAGHLESVGFEVVEAADGMEALALAKAQAPDLVLLDISLPRLDGFYVAELWKRDSAMADVPVIAVSAHTEGNYEERALRSGCASALRKPCAPAEVLEEIRRLLP